MLKARAEEAPVPLQESGEPAPTSYEVLQVHPAAPLELITAAYWRLAGEKQSRRSSDPTAEGELHQLTRAYQTLTNPEVRADYDGSIGVGEQSLAPSLPHSRRGGLLGRGKRDQEADARADYYEILRIVSTAGSPIVEEAYSTMRAYYVRLVLSGYADPVLLDYLEEAYSVTSDRERRSKYDEERRRATRSAAGSGGAVAAAAPVTKAAAKLKRAPAKTGVRLSGVASVRRANGASPFEAVTALAGGAIGAMGRQFSTMSRREQEQVEGRLAEREHEQVDTSEAEAALLYRLSSSVMAPGQEPPDARGATRPIARLTIIDGPGSGATVDLPSFPLTLGGDGECDITLPGLASRQARLLYRDGRFVVYNLVAPQSDGSTDSAPWWILESGEDLGLGPYRLRFAAAGD